MPRSSRRGRPRHTRKRPDRRRPRPSAASPGALSGAVGRRRMAEFRRPCSLWRALQGYSYASGDKGCKLRRTLPFSLGGRRARVMRSRALRARCRRSRMPSGPGCLARSPRGLADRRPGGGLREQPGRCAQSFAGRRAQGEQSVESLRFCRCGQPIDGGLGRGQVAGHGIRWRLRHCVPPPLSTRRDLRTGASNCGRASGR